MDPRQPIRSAARGRKPREEKEKRGRTNQRQEKEEPQDGDQQKRQKRAKKKEKGTSAHKQRRGQRADGRTTEGGTSPRPPAPKASTHQRSDKERRGRKEKEGYKITPGKAATRATEGLRNCTPDQPQRATMQVQFHPTTETYLDSEQT